ncbi:hypothetical protein NLU13_3088 [Sarocladium strictum]|uniref:LPXTG-motif cell wall anchor domain protein n=1 Tax=Sarocladium strictum TaxID=5046 RepID=A0AA39GLC6_SARSR|nr:hypothetical protein NLU13_3088 [Sarocladium strictum]
MTDSGSFTAAGPCATAAAASTGATSSAMTGSTSNSSGSTDANPAAASTTVTKVDPVPVSAESISPAAATVTTETASDAATTAAVNKTAATRASSPNLASQHSNLSHSNANANANANDHGNLRDVPSDAHPSDKLHSHRQNHNQSKLPAFRFADRLKGAVSVSSPSLVPRGPPSPVSPNPDPSNTHKQVVGDTVISPTLTTHLSSPRNQTLPASPLSSDDNIPYTTPLARSLNQSVAAFESSPKNNQNLTVTATTVDLPPRGKRPTSLPDSSAPAPAPVTEVVIREKPWQSRRSPASRSSSDSAVSEGYLTSRSRQRILAAATDKSTKEGASGRRELLLPKTLSQTAHHHERRDSASNRPPVSYKPPTGASSTQSVPSTPVRVPPIRGFRSSGSRKSLTLDMNFSRPFEFPGDVDDPNHDHTLRALEGRRESEGHMTLPPSSAGADGSADDEGDMFLRIARQESASRAREGYTYDDSQTSVSRVRGSHRRPLSTNVATYTPTSPPQLTRRLSDQQETARPRRYLEERGTEIARSHTTRLASREKSASVHPGEDLALLRTSQRPPFTPRASGATQDLSHDSSFSTRRRPSITESNSGSQARTPVYKTYAQQAPSSATKGYSSSPLVRSFDLNAQHNQERGHGMEGTESSLSTAAPSTVWDELDDIRSRINRLELTGKLPSTSGAAVSRVSDDRPATAGTTVTTVSSSPKRHGAGVAQTEVGSTTSSQREAHPVLHTALTRTKPYLSPDVFRALESAANDAMSLSSMMGLPGQPGPISSGASTIGAGTTLTDRQLRRKADSVCRSLTELCVALGEDAPPTKTPQAAQTVVNSHGDGPLTPVASTSFAAQRRPSMSGEPGLLKAPNSPKGISKFEERRQTLLNGSLLPSPRVAGSSPSTPFDAGPNRRSSLLIGRTRRAGTEEPEEGRGSSLLVRARRAGTEEPEEGRKTSLLVRNRRGTIGEDDADARLRAPSRATTEVNTTRIARDYGSASGNGQEPATPGHSALPRRRLPSSINTSRLAVPAAAPTTTTPARRYLERYVPATEANNYPDTPIDNRRVSMIGQSSLPARTTSLSTRRQNRDSNITSISTSATTGDTYD